MDRLNQLRDAVRGGDATLDTSSPPSEAYMSANDTSSKYFSLSDSTFDLSPIKDVSLASASAAEPEHTLRDPEALLSNLSPITKKDVMLDSFKIGKQIEAANILSGGVDIFDDNDNSFDGDELVIDDNVEIDDKTSLDEKLPLEEAISEGTLVETRVDVASRDTEVVLQIDGKNVDAIDIGNGLYLYRKAGQDELAAVQIITEENQAPCFKFLKVRENVEGNLEVYEEFEIEVSKEVPVNEARSSAKKTPNTKNTGKVKSESSTKVEEKKTSTPPKEVSTSKIEVKSEDSEPESKTELNLIGKMMKFNESRKSPVVSTFTPMTYSSTPNKEGKPLTKTMVDQQLHPNRHSDNVKKTIEVHTDSQTKKLADEFNKQKLETQTKKTVSADIIKEISTGKTIIKSIQQTGSPDKKDLKKDNDSTSSNADVTVNVELQNITSVSSGDQSKMILGDKISANTVKPPNENKLPVKAGPSITPEFKMKDMDENEKEDVTSKNKELRPSQSVVSKSCAPLINQISKPNTDKTSSNILDNNSSCNISKDDGKKLLDEDSNKAISESSEPKLKIKDQNQGKSTETKQKVEEKLDEFQGNNQFTEKNEPNVAIPQKECSETINDITLSSFEPTKTGKQNNSKADKEIVENKKTIVTTTNTNITTAIKEKEDKVQVDVTKKLEETKQKNALDTEKSHQLAKASSSSSCSNPETNVVAPPGDSTQLSMKKDIEKPKEISDTINIVKVDSKIDPKGTKPSIVNPSKEVIDVKLVPSTDTSKKIEIKADLQTDKLYLVAKPVEKTTLLEVDNKAVSKDEGKALLTADTKVIEKKVEPKIVSQTNKFIPVVKKIEQKSLPKAILLNPIVKKIEPAAAVSKTIEKSSDAKMDEQKTSAKAEKTNQLPKAPDAHIIKAEHKVPATKTFELKTVPKTVLLNPKVAEIKTTKVEKVIPATQQIPRSNAVIITSNKIYAPSKASVDIKIPDGSSDRKLINNNHAAVPFGKWTDANRQEFLNKFKEIKVPATSTSKQIKNSNDLNRIDVLKKIDSQRSNTASAKAIDKSNVKDTVFSSKIAQPKVETKIPIKNEGLKIKAKPVDTKINSKPDDASTIVSSTVSSTVGTSVVTVVEQEERREVCVNDLIGKAIVDMLNRPVPMPMTRSTLDDPRHVDNRDAHETKAEATGENQNLDIDQQKLKTDQQKLNIDQQKVKIDKQKLNSDQQKMKNDQQKLNTEQHKLKIDQRKLNSDQQKLNIEQKIDEDSSGSLDDIEMKMNELHGIPFVERPPHELPRVFKTYGKSSKDKAKTPTPATIKPPSTSDKVIDLESEEEVIEHEPITGDIDSSKKITSRTALPSVAHASESTEPQKKEPVITENDFDKFARRNSITYENCLTVKFDGKEPGNVVQSVKEKETMKTHPKKELDRTEALTKLPHKQTFSKVTKPNTKFGAGTEDPNNKNQQSKIHTAYQSMLTAKRQMDHPITIIEDKPVKVVFMDANPEFIPNQLNVQGKELSPAKKTDSTKVSSQAVNSNVTDVLEEKQDDAKAKTKHQRKQVLTPVEAPDLELIQPRDLGVDVSPKKKRKTDDNKAEKNLKNLVHKKSYLLGRASAIDKPASYETINPVKETMNRAETAVERTVSAIDSLVKAAELLDNQSVHSASSSPDSQQNTPVKRGRGRPRKYPLPEENSYSKIASPSPQKKPRLIDAKPVKRDPISDEESSDDEQIIRENWTMGKINENIVCPICNKLFRSENVVFKHVKHCTGVSPTRSELEKRSPRRRKYSRESDSKSFDDSQSDDMESDEKQIESIKSTPKKRISKEPVTKLDEEEVIVIEDTPVKEQDIKIESKTKIRDEKDMPKPVREPVNIPTEETHEKDQKVSQEKPRKNEKVEKEKTLKELADEKLAKKKLEELSEEKIVKATKPVKFSVQRSSNLVCEFCGKTFRQLSYLASHKLQHKKEQLKKLEAKLTAKLQVFSCEVCKKDFKKMHHLVQHKIIHNPEMSTRTTRKSSSEQSDAKVKEQPATKQNDDTSAGFRCEPCDKSFRKLHHLVEHRETHDGINRQKSNAQTVAPTIEKPPPPPQCDVCKKSFRKLHHLIEHKEQHHVEQVEQVETSSDKSDDKSVQSSLSTRDIIHECSLCYMVFPNEHSLNKHFVICQQKKKRQSKAKIKPDNVDGVDIVEEGTNTENNMDVDGAPKIIVEHVIEKDKVESAQESKTTKPENTEDKIKIEKSIDPVPASDKRIDLTEISVPKENEVDKLKSEQAKPGLPIVIDEPVKKAVTPTPEKTEKVDEQQVKVLPKKTPIKNKVAPSVTEKKRQKSFAPLPILPEGKPIESSDDDEVRYMLNPDFKADETNEGKVFMKVRSNKRNSLQIERPNSKDLINRRTSLQHPPKIPRLKAKTVEAKVVPTVKTVSKPLKLEAASTDSDDSDVKYSFPITVTEQAPKTDDTSKEKKLPRKSLADKRKSLGGIAKRKSLGQATAKVKANPPPIRIIKRRTLGVEHRCDCGQLFNSAALLSRHTSLAHTPPRIRRHRDPPAAPAAPVAPAAVASPNTRRSKPELGADKSSSKPKRGAAHRGVPVPEKIRKLMLKAAK